MTIETEMIPLEKAKSEVALVCRRLGLLHLAFALTLVDEFGEARGKQITLKAIKKYSRMIGEKKREVALSQGLEPNKETRGQFRDIPTIGMHDHAETVYINGERRRRAYGCVMAKVWHEYGRDDLGRLYCYVDPVSSMTFDPSSKATHTHTVPDGDEYCELTVRPTTEKERKDILSDDRDWTYIDK